MAFIRINLSGRQFTNQHKKNLFRILFPIDLARHTQHTERGQQNNQNQMARLPAAVHIDMRLFYNQKCCGLFGV